MGGLEKVALRTGFAVLRCMYGLMKLLPVQDKCLFITKVADEAPVDFVVLERALRRRCPKTRIVMLCRTMDDKVRYAFHLFVQMYHLATCKTVFLDRSCLAVHILNHRPDLQVVQLWHALGSMKKFGYAVLDTPEGESSDLARLCHMHEGYTHILISSLKFIEDYREGFGTDGSNVVEIPQPRADLLVDVAYRRARRAALREEFPALAARKTILYCPTFRKVDAAYAQQKIKEFVDLVDFERYNVVYSPHPLAKFDVRDDRVLSLPYPTIDLLNVADVVVSDYSSIIYEAGLLGLPVYLYAYDWDDYRVARAHNIDLESDVPAVFARDAKTLMAAIDAEAFDAEAFAAFIGEYVRMPQRTSCCDAIVDMLSESRREGRI